MVAFKKQPGKPPGPSEPWLGKGISFHYTTIPSLQAGRMHAFRKTRVPYFQAEPRYCKLGDELFVQETWRPHSCPWDVDTGRVFYRADGYQCPLCAARIHKWFCSNSMGPEISRFKIRITEITTTSLHSITVEEMIEEGFYVNDYGFWTIGAKQGRSIIGHEDPITAYSLTWDFQNKTTWVRWEDTDTAMWRFRFEKL